ncbi:neuromedin-U receptor 2-like [Liolophura sinensis]|uniref:neuromedin-U receptor 2-like n=1 Tax=Liolophura sinensis TaxID=3198878 RepID=UPI003158B409
MELIGIPIIVIIGLIGNALSAVTFLNKKMRVMSCSLYLAARAVTDSGFLICLFVIWLQYVGVPIIHTHGVCQAEIFFSYLCGFLSVWFIVWVTVENYYRICQPFKVSLFCTPKKALFRILITTVIGCMIYSVSTWINGIVSRGRKSVCFIKMEYKTISTVLIYGDCFITLILPCAIILIVTSRIIFNILKTYRKRAPARHRGSFRLKATVSKMLLWVSLVFLILNLPSHSVRLRALFEMMTKQTTKPTPLLFVLQRVLQMIFYMSFSINFFIYVSLGPSFRRNFLRITGISRSRNGNQPEINAYEDKLCNGNAPDLLLPDEKANIISKEQTF